jgi:hypothetical protein
MKTYFIGLVAACIYASPTYGSTQQNKTLSSDSTLKKTNRCLSHLSWELQLGSSFLTNTNLSANRPLTDSKTMSGSFFTNISIPFIRKEAAHSPSLAVYIGIGTTIQTFGLNKIIEDSNNTTAFIDFPTSNIRYSYLQQIFIAAPISLSYQPFLSKNLILQVGGIAGYLVYKEHVVHTIEPHEYSIRSTEHINNLNPFQYGIQGKINFKCANAKHSLGCIYSISGNYYISELFKSVNDTPTNNFSILAGIGFFIHR